MDITYNYYLLVVIGKFQPIVSKAIADKVPMSSTTVHKHLKYLRDIKVITSHKENKYTVWKLNYPHIEYLMSKELD